MNLHCRLLCCILPLLLAFSLSMSVAAISLGSSLKASNPDQAWNSPNAGFSLRFLPAGLSSSSSSSFIAGIVYSGTVSIIWSAGGSATVDASGALHFQSDGNLRLVNGSGVVVWESNTAGRGVSSAVLEDSGNLVLLNGRFIPVWSSFDNPTDTIVPSQNFTVNMALRSGPYCFKLLHDGNLTLAWNDDLIYWNQGLNTPINGTLDSPILRLDPTGKLAVFDTRIPLPAGSFVAYSKDYADKPFPIENFWFLKLKNDGSLGIHSVPRGSGTETLGWDAVPNKCEIFGFCGELSICRYNDTSPYCGCPSANFEAIDPNDWKKGCKRKMDIENCSSGVNMLELPNTKLLTYPGNTSGYTMQIAGCRTNCRQSHPCLASTAPSDGTGFCYYVSSGLIRGYHSATLLSTAYLKVCGQVLPMQLQSAVPSQSECRNVKTWILVVVILVAIFAMISFEACLWWWCCRNSLNFGGMSSQYTLLEYASGAPVQFSYKELHRATNGFKEKLGAGGFGAVYKGALNNRTIVAVKQLEGIEQGEKQFRMEVATISTTHHLNLVRLIGFCMEGRHRLLVYELMKNGSLDGLLFKTKEVHSGKFLNWDDRFKIALGTAKGITYLHEECRDCIIHCDIKPENILLDENLNAKVSDFGLAKLINIKDHRNRTLTSVRGTRGYLAPEWLSNLPLTSKSDVFSYGMVLLEIVSGRRNFEVSAETNHKRFSMWAYEEFEKGNLMEIVDKRLMDQETNMEQASKVLQVSFWCIQEQPSQRPMMGKVVQMIEGVVDIERPPAPKVASMVSASGTNTYVSNNMSNLSTTATSAATPTSFSLSLAAADWTSGGRNLEKTTSSLLQSRYD